MGRQGKARKVVAVTCVAAALALTVFFVASCGSSSSPTASKSTSAVKLPPGVTPADVGGTESSVPSSTGSSAPAATSPAPAATTTTGTPGAKADLAGTRFTIVHATRPNTNKSVISSSGREVPGDYLEVELTAFNTGAAGLVDLSQYSFRLLSPGIAASNYADYYGTTGTYGAYVDEHEISASLLSFSDLQPVAYKVKVGETVTKVFVFFDLNPLTDAPNAGVTKDNSQFIVYKTSGTDSGTQVAMPLAGYPD